ncbi:MAG: PIN domain-containing protein [Verrucomicrobiota bacterium]
MKGLVLVDSSAWVEASRLGGDPGITARVEGLIQVGLTAMSEPVWLELYQGARGKREEEQLARWRALSVWLEFDTACWQQAAKIARICLRTGVNVPFGDVLVDACARRYGVELLERDRHFAMIAQAMKG